eukprot:11296055-Alexandrium_andersonii.AAC.1
MLQPSPPFDSVFGEEREVSGEAGEVNAEEGTIDLEAAKNFVDKHIPSKKGESGRLANVRVVMQRGALAAQLFVDALYAGVQVSARDQK